MTLPSKRELARRVSDIEARSPSEMWHSGEWIMQNLREEYDE